MPAPQLKCAPGRGLFVRAVHLFHVASRGAREKGLAAEGAHEGVPARGAQQWKGALQAEHFKQTLVGGGGWYPKNVRKVLVLAWEERGGLLGRATTSSSTTRLH